MAKCLIEDQAGREGICRAVGVVGIREAFQKLKLVFNLFVSSFFFFVSSFQKQERSSFSHRLAHITAEKHH